MGFRTVVMLNNDLCHEWSKDPELGSKIQRAMNFAGTRGEADDRYRDSIGDGYGRAVECTHADNITLVRLDHYTGFEPLAHDSFWRDRDGEHHNLALLKAAAEKLGYTLRKNPVRKPRLPRTKGE
jgi:hypothetical protein